MSSFRQWVVQLRYPYTAGIIGVIWMGTAFFSMIAPGTSTVVLIVLTAIATVFLAAIGLAPSR